MASSALDLPVSSFDAPIRICVTCGDLNGVGLEVFLKALWRIAQDDGHALGRASEARLTLLAPLHRVQAYFDAVWRANPKAFPPQYEWDSHSLDARHARLRIGNVSCRVGLPEDANAEKAGRAAVRNEAQDEMQEAPEFGAETVEGGRIALASLQASVRALRNAEADAVCTMPVSKRALHMAGFPFPGQTEFYGDAFPSGAPPTMILATEAAALDPARAPVRVGLATVHIPLGQVAGALNVDLLMRQLESLRAALRQDFGVAAPRLAVLGLNPHAGEGGILGDEEQAIIEPALAKARARGVHAEGPFPADGFFARGEYRRFDAILAMYHDQGLIPLKLLAGAGGVNITAGLSIVRVSPDHGAAFGIAGRGVADEQSALEALETAFQIARRRREQARLVKDSF
jgi:4-hydroxythreonine-4-phosphate dehydrogenase